MLKTILNSVLLSFTYIWNYEKHIRLIYFRNYIYSLWIKAYSKNIGNNFLVYKPFTLIGNKYIKIGENFNGKSNIRIECLDAYANNVFKPRLIIGNNVVMNYNVHIACINSIIIGNNVLFASNIFITDHFHGKTHDFDFNIPPVKRELFSKGAVVIEDNVWIGENVSIMPNIKIGRGCIIGANSLITKSFPANSIIGGVPAKIIKKYE